MKKRKSFFRRYFISFILALTLIVLYLVKPEIGLKVIDGTKLNFIQMLSIIPPIFILLGLLDVWIDRETMIKYMGKGSGIKGTVLAFLLGSCAAGPLYIAFPIAGMLVKKRASFFNVFIFIGAWSTTKIPMFLFETGSMGWKFSLLRLGLSIGGIVFIAFVMNKTTNENDKEIAYQNCSNMNNKQMNK